MDRSLAVYALALAALLGALITGIPVSAAEPATGKPAAVQVHPDPGFDDPAIWAFHQFNGFGTGAVAGGIASVTHTGADGGGGTISTRLPRVAGTAWLTPGQGYEVSVDRNYTALGPSAVTELWIGEDPALAGDGDYPGNVEGDMVLKDDCWGGGGCGSTGGLTPMRRDAGALGSPWTYNPANWTDGRVWYVLKVLAWGPGTAQTVEFDNASFSYFAEYIPDPGMENPAAWTFREFTASGAGGVGSISGGKASITHPGGGGGGGNFSVELITEHSPQLSNGHSYEITVDRRFSVLGPSAVAELWVGENPALAGGGDYPGDVAGDLIVKDDCWASTCGDTGGFAPMPVWEPAPGNPWTYNYGDWTSGNVWYVLKVLGWGPGTAQTVEFDNASVTEYVAPPGLVGWMLY